LRDAERDRAKGAPEAIADLCHLDPKRTGASVLAASLPVYSAALHTSSSADEARAPAMIGLTARNLLVVWANASQGVGWRPLLCSLPA
jgi:hypothetical protein